MRTRRVCVTAQSKTSYCIIAGQKLSLRYCKNQAVGRNLSLPYIPLSLRSTLSQNTVCVFQNSQFEIALVSLWPLTIPVFEYPSAELSFSLSWKIILSKLQVTRSSPVAFAGFQHLRRILWPGSRQREDTQTDRQTLSLTITAFKSYLVWHLDYSSLLTTHSDHQSLFWYFRMNLWGREQIF